MSQSELLSQAFREKAPLVDWRQTAQTRYAKPDMSFIEGVNQDEAGQQTKLPLDALQRGQQKVDQRMAQYPAPQVSGQQTNNRWLTPERQDSLAQFFDGLQQTGNAVSQTGGNYEVLGQPRMYGGGPIQQGMNSGQAGLLALMQAITGMGGRR